MPSSPANLVHTDPDASGSRMRRHAVLGASLFGILSLVTVGSVWVLETPRAQQVQVTVDAVTVAAVVGSSLFLSWSRLPRRALLLYPVAGLAELALLGTRTTGVSGVYAGFLVLVFVYVGFVGTSRDVLALLPVAAGTWLLLNDVQRVGVDAALLSRLAIVIGVWAAVGIVTARRSAAEQGEHDRLLDGMGTDGVTGLEDRRALRRALESVRVGDTVVVLRVDEFPDLRLSRGPVAAEAVLTAFGRVAKLDLWTHDRAIRIAADDFVLVLARASGGRVRSVLGAIREHWREDAGKVTFSVGAATAAPGERWDQLLSRASGLCREAGEAGPDRWVIEGMGPDDLWAPVDDEGTGPAGSDPVDPRPRHEPAASERPAARGPGP